MARTCIFFYRIYRYDPESLNGMTQVKEQGKNFTEAESQLKALVQILKENFLFANSQWIIFSSANVKQAMHTWGLKLRSREVKGNSPILKTAYTIDLFCFSWKTLGRPFVVNLKKHLYRLFFLIRYNRIFYKWPWSLILCNIKDEKDYWFRIKEVQHNILASVKLLHDFTSEGH